jgi:molecular chaperone DnaK (HSP70)
MGGAKYLIGIDLGTSNCAVAYVEPERGAQAPVVDFEIPQLVRPGEVASLDLLPSCVYLPGPHETTGDNERFAWATDPGGIVGEFARWQGARVPGRLVVSSKSWLCHAGVDREAAILPWGAPADVAKLSPVAAAARLLKHIALAWNEAHPDAPLASQEVVVTVPASFDEVARALTVQAARTAGYENFRLLEEPQAAFYDFTARHRQNLGAVLEGIRLVLVVDVGGGTSDFTLVQTSETAEGPVLRRIAVGEHLMLGGDNMDAALGRLLEERMVGKGRRLTMTQWTQLTQAARAAKENLLGATPRRSRNQKRGAPSADGEFYTVSVASEGSRLIGGALSSRIERAEAQSAVLDGFFPACDASAIPERGGRAALQEVGLPFAHDAAITRHLAAFLRAHATAAHVALGQPGDTAGLPRPDAVLLNGGVFNSPAITKKLLKVLSSWWPDAEPLRLLAHGSLDLAVARGAAFYGLARRGLGRRIGGGAAHALYVGLETAGTEGPKALCVIPRGQAEGTPLDLGERTFRLSLGRPVRFPLYSTAADRPEKSGDVVSIGDDFHALPPIHTLLKGTGTKDGMVPVHLRAMLTEIGTLELWCVSDNSSERWRLEFELRGETPSNEVTLTESMPATFGEARASIERCFAPKAGKVPAQAPPKEVKQLWSSLESTLGPRDGWGLPVLRELWSALFAGAPRRRRSPEHERVFFQLLGYTLRPGFGYALDEWRCEQSAGLFAQGVNFQAEKAVWNEYWVLWRRIAGGLNPGRHEEIWAHLKPFLALRVPPKPARHLPRPKGPQPEGTDEMARLAASLEHLPWQEKLEFGEWILARLLDPEQARGPWAWALGRLGARAPIYGSIHQVIPPAPILSWITKLLEPRLRQLEGGFFALAQLARLTGDRVRDLDEATRGGVLRALESADASPSWQRMVSEVVPLAAADRARALGDTLPVGLQLE